MLKQTLTKTLMICAVTVLAISQFADAQNFNLDINEGLVLWNTLGSDSELQNSEVGPAVTALQTPSYSAALNGFGIVSDNDDPVAQIPSSVLNIEEGTISLWIKLISVPATYPNATEHLFLYTPENSLRFLSNDGYAHSGWFAHAGGSRLYSINSFGTTSTSSLGINNEEILLTIRWDSSGVTGHGSEKLVFFRNEVKIGTYWETGATWPANFSDDLLLNEARYNPNYASGTVDLDLIYDDIKVYNHSLSDQDVVDLYNGAIPELITPPSIIVFNSNRDGDNELYSMNPDGSNQVNLSNNSASDLYPTSSPDGTKIVFSSDRDGDAEIYSMDADGSNLVRLTNNSFNDQGPVFSPDANKIAYYNYQYGRTEVFVMDADGTNQTRLTGVTGYHGWNYGAVWSPDGSRIAFRSDNGGNSNIWLMDAADGANLVNLTNTTTAWEEGPNWSPDGSQIIFHSKTSFSATTWDIWAIDIDGTNLTNLTNNPDHTETASCWSPDGSQITFNSNRNGDNQIFVMDSDGSNQVGITSNTGFNNWKPWWGTGTESEAPILLVSPDSLDFGANLPGVISTRTTTIKNTGTADLNVSSIAITGVDSLNFSVDATSFIITPGDSTLLDVSFTPDDTDSFSATLDIESDGGSTSVSLSGNGVAPADQNSQLAFDGTDDYCAVNDGLGLFSELNIFTVELWVKLEHPNLGFGKLIGAPDNNFFYFIVTNQGSPQFRTGSGTNIVAGNMGSVSTSTSNWVHLAFVKAGTGAGEGKVYVNGVDQTIAMFNDPGTTPSLTGQLDFGRFNGSNELWGRMDDIRIWNVARSQTEIQENLNIELNGSESGFIGYWNFNEETGQYILDSQTNAAGHNGTLGADNSIGDDDPTRISDPPFGPPELLVSPSSIDFGDVLAGESSTEQVILTNTGITDLNVSSIAISGVDSVNFSVDTTTFTLVPDSSIFLDVNFTPNDTGSFSASLDIDSDGGGVAVNLVGIGVAPESLVSPLSIDFSYVLVGETATEQVKVSNTGTADLNVSSVLISGVDSVNFSVDTTLFTIMPGDSMLLEVSFTPDTVSVFGASLGIESDGGSASVNLAGTGATPELSLSLLSIDFGDVVVGETTTEPVTVSNVGTTDLTVSSIAITGDDAVNFSVAPVPYTTIPFTLVPGGSQILEVSFTPDTVDSLSASLQIDSDGGSAGVALVGNGIAFPILLVTPLAIDFGAIPEGDTATEQVTVTNPGTADLNISSIAITGTDFSNFEVDTTTFILAPDEGQILDVNFSPDQVGSFSASLEIESDSGSVSIDLNGVGVDPIPLIISITDVPEDQGRLVHLSWLPSDFDALGEITQYGIWEFNPEDEWVSLGNVPSIQADHYTFLAITYGDSTDEGIFWSVFMVTAHTTEPEVFFESAVDSGYSVDNLAPAVPTGLLASVTEENTVELSWDSPVDEDFNYVKIYRSLTPDFDPAGMEPFAETIETTFIDSDVEIGETYYYILSAVDFNGNESDYSEAIDATVLSTADELGIPTEFSLGQNYPNPFNPVTTLRYDLPEQAYVTLIIYDLLGREMKTLVNRIEEPGYKSVVWDGVDNAGQPVGAGVFLYRISSDKFTKVNKMILLR